MWRPLDAGFLRVNVDWSFLENSNKRGIRGVIRYSRGNVLLQFCKKVQLESTVHVEVLALREGLSSCRGITLGVILLFFV